MQKFASIILLKESDDLTKWDGSYGHVRLDNFKQTYNKIFPNEHGHTFQKFDQIIYFFYKV